MYFYIYIYRERERDIDITNIHIYIYIYYIGASSIDPTADEFTIIFTTSRQYNIT